jgi:GT2 family glycosyltransferase
VTEAAARALHELDPQTTPAVAASVVVPVYNARRTIELCVDGLLRQTRLPNAIYVVDNGSTDGTYEWLLERAGREPRLQVLRELTRGQSHARNTALRAIGDGIVVFTDADCVPEPQWLADLAGAYADPSTAAVAGPVVGYQPRTLVERYLAIIGFSLQDRPAVVRRCVPFAAFPTANLSARVEVLRRIGEFDGKMSPSGEDFDLCYRILRAGGIIHYTPGARVAHIHRSTLGAMLRRTFEYGGARPKLFRKHFRGIAHVVIGGRIVGIRAPVTLCVNLTSPEKVSLALIALSFLSPWFLAALGLYWVRLGRRLDRAARRQGIVVRTGGEQALLVGLHLLEFCASTAGSVVGSLRHRVFCA